jgi:hypothetical protein
MDKPQTPCLPLPFGNERTASRDNANIGAQGAVWAAVKGRGVTGGRMV